MLDSKLLSQYFPDIEPFKRKILLSLKDFYEEENNKINVVSRKDFDHFFAHHVLHSLSIGKWATFSPKTQILDIGTGGGFPGIPLAIIFPEVEFVLIDSIAKKIKVVQACVEEFQLQNVRCIVGRAEEIKEKYHFITCRAVTAMPTILQWVSGKFLKDNSISTFIQNQSQHSLTNGIIALKGGDLATELAGIDHTEFPISTLYKEEYFQTKKIIYVPRNAIFNS